MSELTRIELVTTPANKVCFWPTLKMSLFDADAPGCKVFNFGPDYFDRKTQHSKYLNAVSCKLNMVMGRMAQVALEGKASMCYVLWFPENFDGSYNFVTTLDKGSTRFRNLSMSGDGQWHMCHDTPSELPWYQDYVSAFINDEIEDVVQYEVVYKW